MKPKSKKEEELNELKKDLAEAKNLIVAQFQGMTVAQDTDLRAEDSGDEQQVSRREEHAGEDCREGHAGGEAGRSLSKGPRRSRTTIRIRLRWRRR